MATKELLRAIDFRRANLRLDGVARIVVRYGAGKDKGHAAARKFFKNYLPILLYHNPDIEASVRKYEDAAAGAGAAAAGGGGGDGGAAKARRAEAKAPGGGAEPAAPEPRGVGAASAAASSASSVSNALTALAAACEASLEPHVAVFLRADGEGRVFRTQQLAEAFRAQEQEAGDGASGDVATAGAAGATAGSEAGPGPGPVPGSASGLPPRLRGAAAKGLSLHVDRYIFREITGGSDVVAVEAKRKPQGKKGRRAGAGAGGAGAQKGAAKAELEVDAAAPAEALA